MKKMLVRSLAMAAIAFWADSAAANSIDVDLQQISGADELIGQFHLTIYDQKQYSGSPDHVLFSFTNDAVMPASVAEIRINGDTLFSSIDSLYQSNGVDFAVAGSAASGFELRGNSQGAGAPGGMWNPGLDRAGEHLGVVFTLIPGVTLASIIDKFQGPPWISVHPGAGGNDDPLDDGHTAPVPEPISMMLFGIGTAGIIGLRRKQRGAW